MIAQLNDDCQLRIINYLNLKNQVALWKANNNYSLRLNANICRAWKTQKMHSLTRVMSVLKDDPKILNAYMLNICETLKSMGLNGLTLKHLNLLYQYQFPNMRELDLEFNDWFDETEHEFELLAEMFPSLNSLTMWNVHVDCFKIEKFKQLRKLHLWCCINIDTVFGSESLEELIIDLGANENSFYCYALMCLPKLRTLALSCDECSQQFLRPIIIERSNDITEFSFHSCIWKYCDLTILHSAKSLRRLTLIEEDFTVENLIFLVEGFPQLEQLDLVDFNLFSAEVQLWQTVAACPSLKILNISGMKLKNDFFALSRRYMEQVLNNRLVPLTLNCHKTGGYRHIVST